MTAPKLNLLILKSPDIEALRAFYELLGCVFESEQHGDGPSHYSAALGGVLLELYPLAEGTAPVDTSTRIGFSVEGVDDAVTRLVEGGVELVKPVAQTEWGLKAIVHDPDGRAVELLE